jgi:hypothetical protein
MGGRADEFGPEGGGETPEEAFASWLSVNPFGLPQSGYRQLGAVGDRWVWTYAVDDSVKVVVVISPRFAHFVDRPFTVDEMRTCDPSEWGALVDLGPDTRVWAHADTGAVVTDIAGPSHCGWESARLLHLTHADGTLDRQYVRDPLGVLPAGSLLGRYEEGVEPPPDAFDSGYRAEGGLQIWFTESDTALYVIGPDGTERWPRADEPIGCA